MNALFLAPYIIARRLPQLWYEALHPNPMVSEESQRAVTEKFAAVGEGILAAQAEALNTPFRVGTAFFNGQSVALAAMATPEKVAKAAVAPMERRLKANAKRLTKGFRL